MGFKDKMLSKITARVGRVISGKYEGSEFGIGDDRGKIFGSIKKCNQILIFTKSGDINPRLTFGKEITSIDNDFTVHYSDGSQSILQPYDEQKSLMLHECILYALEQKQMKLEQRFQELEKKRQQ